jgi:hypothetical protein
MEMSAIQSKIIATGLLFVCVFGSGFWLSGTGKPLNTGLLTVHKLASLAAAVVIGLTVRQLNGQVKMSAVEIGAAAATALLFILTIATGGLLSTGKPVPAAVSVAHRVAPFLTVLSTIVTVGLLTRGR